MNDAPAAAPLLTPDSPAADHKDYAQPWGTIAFQKGAMELGRNGWTTEELLVILIDHIGGFQKGKFACEENAALLDNLEAGLYWVQLRAEARKAQGVKGRDAIHDAPVTTALEPIMRFFEYAHLPLKLATVSRPFAVVAKLIVANIDRSAERTVALRKLLEGKDAAVRASLPDPNKPEAGQLGKAGPC